MDMPPDLDKHAAGPIGSLIALLWSSARWPRNIGLFFAGSALSYLFGEEVLLFVNSSLDIKLRPVAVYGFIGLFGIATVSKLLDTWEAFDAGEVLRKWLGLPPRDGGKK